MPSNIDARRYSDEWISVPLNVPAICGIDGCHCVPLAHVNVRYLRSLAGAQPHVPHAVGRLLGMLDAHTEMDVRRDARRVGDIADVGQDLAVVGVVGVVSGIGWPRYPDSWRDEMKCAESYIGEPSLV